MDTRMQLGQIVHVVKPKTIPNRAGDAAEVENIFPRRLLDDEAEYRVCDRHADGAANVSCNEFASL